MCSSARFVSAGPFFVQSHAIGCESEIVVGGGSDEHWRRVRWDGNVYESSCRSVDHGDEGGPAIRRVTEGNSGSDRSTGGEPHDADAIGRDSPVRCVLSNIGDRGQAIGNGQGNDLIYYLLKFLPVCKQRGEFLGGVLARVRRGGTSAQRW